MRRARTCTRTTLPAPSTRTATACAPSRLLVEEYGLEDPALQLLSRIVHGADISDDRDATPQSRGLLAVAEGFHLLGLDDHRQLELSLPVYDALYAWCRNEVTAARAAE